MSDQIKNQSTTNQIQLTATGFADLQNELKILTEQKLPELVKRITIAREKGDLSENTEYQNAKEDKQIIEARMSEIEKVLARAEVVTKTKSRNTIGIGSQVVVQLASQKKTKLSFQLVGEFEADPDQGKISSVSPLGKAILGRKEGDQVVVQAPAGAVTYLIAEVN